MLIDVSGAASDSAKNLPHRAFEGIACGFWKVWIGCRHLARVTTFNGTIPDFLMARSSEQALDDRERASELSWEDLDMLWSDLQNDGAAGWASGKALEHLVVRGFSLSGLVVEYPYDVPLGGRPLEQIDGLVYLGEVPFLIECKDRDSVDIEAIAKLRNQLLRRPPSTMGCVFVSGTFTRPAIILSDFAAPHRITLWSNLDISEAIRTRSFADTLRRKYHDLCMFGLTDHSPHYRELEADAEDE